MPFVISHPRRGARALLVAAGAAAALALPAAPALAHKPAGASTQPAPVEAPITETAVTGPPGTDVSAPEPQGADVCTPASFSKPFQRWGDSNDYTLAPGGDMEEGAPGWTLSPGAEIVEANNWFRVGDRSDRSSLLLRPGSSALSAPVCIDSTYSSFRFFARRALPANSDLRVDVLWWESGATHSTTVELHPFTGLIWAPVSPVELPGAHLATDGLEPIQFRFTVTGRSGAWLLDDVYVDPFSRG
jgi:hypothetical protein